jgi:glycosyltransferase involved in cell wall biosynthesis
VVLSPSPASDQRLGQLGIDEQLIRRWDRGVDIRRFDPKLRTPGLLSVDVNVLYVGRLTKEKGVDLLADAFLAARERDPRLHLVLAGGGPEEEQLRDRLGTARRSWAGSPAGIWRAHMRGAPTCCSQAAPTRSAGRARAQASGAAGRRRRRGPATLIEHGETGLLAPPRADAIAEALLSVVSDGNRGRACARRSPPARWAHLGGVGRLAAALSRALRQRAAGNATAARRLTSRSPPP